MTRREFLFGTGSLATTMPFRASAQPEYGNGYRALVQIELDGGNDAFNTLIPIAPSQHSWYRRWRGNLALARKILLPLEGGSEGAGLALHPALPGIHAMYLNQSIAVLAGMGPLIEPYDPQSTPTPHARLPRGLFAHRAQSDYSYGMLEQLTVALAAAGFDAQCTRMTVDTSRAGLDSSNALIHTLDLVMQSILLRRRNQGARDLIRIRLGGWDHHRDALALHARALGSLDAGLVRLRNALLREGAQNEVTVITASEFGRALEPDGSGCNHGWSGHHFLMGAAIRGGRVYGDYPDLAPDGPLHVGCGVFAPTLSVDAVSAALVGWLASRHLIL